MLSYMLPVEEKPPTGAAPDKGRLQLELEGRGASPPTASPDRPSKRVLKSSIISKESSVSSFASSDVTGSSITPTGVDKPKLKLLSNGTKHTTLKRVSFGSSKGSMVETLIYESPLQEEPETTSPQLPYDAPFPFPVDDSSERSKVRVSFYQSVCAQSVAEQQFLEPPEAAPPDSLAMAASPDPVVYNRQASTESGWDNPFRPDGDLSREADEIVSLIRGGKPITPTPGSSVPLLPSLDETDRDAANNHGVATPITQSPQKQVKATNLQSAVKNGTSNGGGGPMEDTVPATGPVDIQHTGPQEPLHPEHVVIKKKPKCKCCVIQ
ncbi:uncharacterized protein LOC143922616 isoform X2 [Arctopsyche grandis]|uniref:uncharacterized protein LOC143922616 isoform X2 n=1 Tax=Arctopsyche grandis TaxID=121162 RepID=UPI00406D93E5